MALPVVAFLLGLSLLAWGAPRFVDSSSAIARHLGVRPLLIGMVIVGCGTSAPELVVSAMAALEGKPGLALGNAIGSNLANLGLILGVAALLLPITLNSPALRRETRVLAAITMLLAVLIADGSLGRLDAGLLFGSLAIALAWSVREGMSRGDALGREVSERLADRALPLVRSVIGTGLGLAVILASSRLIVWGATELARSFGWSDLVIGLTIVAVGTSLPELSAAISAALKGEDDLALGNVLGSNLFNTTAVVGLAALLRPMAVDPELLRRDLALVGVLTLALAILSHMPRGRIGRTMGAGLATAYLAYLGWHGGAFP